MKKINMTRIFMKKKIRIMIMKLNRKIPRKKSLLLKTSSLITKKNNRNQ